MLLNPRVRAAFTLVELLVAVSIVGVLASLAIVGGQRALSNVREKATLVEIDQLSTALHALKGRNRKFPPSHAAFAPNNGPAYAPDRPTLFDAYIRVAFPRCTIPYTSLHPALKKGAFPYAYTYRTPDGTIDQLNLAELDPAEALVFWLGGFPAPVDSNGNPLTSRKLIGFNLDERNPFRLDAGSGDAMTKGRSQAQFDFDETRLVDVDGDGWLEYIPKLSVPTSPPPPYVYFDADLYRLLPKLGDGLPYRSYPPVASEKNVKAIQVDTWGVAVPYAAYAEPGKTLRWVNGDSFQIICAGRDGMYGDPTATHKRVSAFPFGTTYHGSGFKVAEPDYEVGEDDNLTNFAESSLGDASVH